MPTKTTGALLWHWSLSLSSSLHPCPATLASPVSPFRQFQAPFIEHFSAQHSWFTILLFSVRFILFSTGNTTLSERRYSHLIKTAHSKRCGQRHRSWLQAFFPTVWSIKSKEYCERIQWNYHQVQVILAYIKNFNEPDHLALLFSVNAILTAVFSFQPHFIT